MDDEITLVDFVQLYTSNIFASYKTVYDFVRSLFVNTGVSNLNIIYDWKNYDVRRGGSGIFFWIEELDEDYVGFGNEAFADYAVGARLYLMGQQTSAQLSNIISGFHKNVADYSARGDMIENELVVWAKIMTEENLQSGVRGATIYQFHVQVRVYVPQMGHVYGVVR